MAQVGTLVLVTETSWVTNHGLPADHLVSCLVAVILAELRGFLPLCLISHGHSPKNIFFLLKGKKWKKNEWKMLKGH